MAIDLCLTNRKSGESTFVPICTASTFEGSWLPASKELGLEMIECLPGLTINAEFKQQFLDELQIFRNWVISHEAANRRQSILASLDQLFDIVKGNSFEEYDLSTG
jgi:hypothetical protein